MEKQKTFVKKIPRFGRQNRRLKKRVGGAWRKPRGIDNKQRVQKKGFGPLPKIGYGKPRATRGLHPSGLREVLVSNPGQLQAIDKAGQAARIASQTGSRKRFEIAKKARELGIRVLN